MADVNQAEKETETGVAELHSSEDEDEVQQGITSPVDCWELVGSSPGSPLPEARGDVTALEEAIASACNSDSLLQDNYFGCAHSLTDDGVLPVSTTMTDKPNDDDGHSSERSDGLISLAADAIGNCTIRNDSMFHGNHMDNVELVGHDDGMHQDDDGMHQDDHTHVNDIYHDDLPHCSNLMCYDDQVQHSVDVLDHHKVHDEFMMYPNELMEHADSWHLEDETHFEGIMHIDGDSEQRINHLGRSCGIVESMAVTNVYRDECTSGLSESPSRSPMSLHGAAGVIDMSNVSNFTVQSEETGREATSEVLQVSESVDVQHGTINTYNKKQHKGFVYVSWIWTQLIRWQTQLGHGNTIWSVALAAAVMGILVLGRGWQRLQAQNQSLRSQLWAKEKRITQLMFQLMQTKDALAKVRRVPVICVKPSLRVPQDNF